MKDDKNLNDNKRKRPYGQLFASIIVATILLYSVLSINDPEFQIRSVGIIVFLVAVNIVIIWIPNRFSENIQVWISRILFVVAPLFSFFIVERFNYINIWDIENKRFILNIIIISFLLFFFYLVTNSTKYASVILIALLYIIALANFFVFNFRGTPILASDITSMGTAANVAANYSYEINSRIIINGLIASSFILVICRMIAGTGLLWKKRIATFLLFSTLLGIFLFNFYETDQIDNAGIRVSVWYPQKSYRVNGFVLSFMVTSKYVKIDKPQDYSLNEIDSIIKDYHSDTEIDSINPNVIAIMDESFTDLNLDGTLDISEDYMPFIRNLKDNTVKGTLYMSVFGGNTANSEFEFLTGNTLGFLPTRSVPYELYIKNPLASLTYTLKAQGYIGNKAIHPYKGDGWARTTTYPLLGFEDFLTIDDFENPNLIRKYISDSDSFNKIIEQYEESRKQGDEPFYTFNVTMQNHGGYGRDYDNLARNIKLLGNHVDDQAERYVNLGKKTDEALEGLVNYFAAIKEPTVIVFFGDHQPGLDTSFYNKIIGKNEEDLSAEEAMKKYQVPFIIWANYDIEEKQYDMLSANYLSSVLLDTIGIRKTGYNKFLLDIQEQVPVITANGYFGGDGKFYQFEEESPYKDILRKYSLLQYNNMFDYGNRRNQFFFLEDVKQ